MAMVFSALQAFLCLPINLPSRFWEVYLQWTQEHGIPFIKDHALPDFVGWALISSGFVACVTLGLALLTIVCMLSYCTFVIVTRPIYNLYFHPLRHFPGPWAARASSLPYAWRFLRGTRVSWTTELHKRFGDVVCLQPDELSFTKAQAWTDIYSSRPQLPKSEIAQLVSPSGVRPLATIVKTEDHTRQRKIISHAFSERALKDQESILQGYTDLLIERMHDHAEAGKEVDICAWYSFITFDIIGDLCFAESFKSLQTGKHHWWVEQILQGTFAAHSMTVVTLFPPLGAVLAPLLPSSLKKIAAKPFEYTRDLIDKRIARGTDRPDFMKYILENNSSSKQGMNKDELDSNVQLLIFAGTETSSSAMTAATWFLLNNAAAMDKLQREIRSSFDQAGDMNIAAVSKLPYLHAVIQEAMRLHPPGPAAVQRYVDRPVEIAGDSVPVGARVGVSHKTIYRLESHFTEPDSFLPERWMPDTEAKFQTDDRDAFQPFLLGPRNCIGKNIARAEMKLTLAKLIFEFNIELSENNVKDWADQKIYLVHESQPLNVVMKPRKSA